MSIGSWTRHPYVLQQIAGPEVFLPHITGLAGYRSETRGLKQATDVKSLQVRQFRVVQTNQNSTLEDIRAVFEPEEAVGMSDPELRNLLHQVATHGKSSCQRICRPRVPANWHLGTWCRAGPQPDSAYYQGLCRTTKLSFQSPTQLRLLVPQGSSLSTTELFTCRTSEKLTARLCPKLLRPLYHWCGGWHVRDLHL